MAMPVFPKVGAASFFDQRYVSVDDPGYGIAKGRTTVYRVERLSISGAHSAPRQDVWIIADRIDATSATIDVSGAAGSPSYARNQKAPGGSSPGQAGTDADKSSLPRAGDGRSVGNITIVCRTLVGSLTLRADGGRGGDGLNGGDASKGTTGPAGPGKQLNAAAAKGGTGGQGGKAGDGGTAGTGGDSGIVSVHVLDRSTATLNVSAVPGAPGLLGLPGVPGLPGDGGPPGNYGHSEWSGRQVN